jgi:hypothetical protein
MSQGGEKTHERRRSRSEGVRHPRQSRGSPADRQESRREHRRPKPRPQIQAVTPRWRKESGLKTCRKCGGRMYPADWISQRYGLCLGWRCQKCKEKVLARSLPFKGLRKRRPDPDEVHDRTEHRRRKASP